MTRAPDEKKSPPDTSRRLTYYIKAAEAVQRGLTEPRLRDLGISFAQLAMLMSIRNTPNVSSADLARRLGTTPQSTGEVVGALLRKGLIERVEDKMSRRILRLRMLPSGTALLDRTDLILSEIEAAWIAGLDPEAVASAKALLGELIARGNGPSVLDGMVG